MFQRFSSATQLRLFCYWRVDTLAMALQHAEKFVANTTSWKHSKATKETTSLSYLSTSLLTTHTFKRSYFYYRLAPPPALLAIMTYITPHRSTKPNKEKANHLSNPCWSSHHLEHTLYPFRLPKHPFDFLGLSRSGDPFTPNWVKAANLHSTMFIKDCTHRCGAA